MRYAEVIARLNDEKHVFRFRSELLYQETVECFDEAVRLIEAEVMPVDVLSSVEFIASNLFHIYSKYLDLDPSYSSLIDDSELRQEYNAWLQKSMHLALFGVVEANHE